MTRARRPRRSPRRTYALIGGLAGSVLVIAGVLVFDLPVYPAWVIGLSIVTFVLYGFDKRQAIRRASRVPEVVFHGLALAGGFPGGWAGRAIFRHKTRHMSFAIVLALATVIHAGLIWQLR